MDISQILERWQEMWQEGNWIPSWPDSLAGLTAAEAAWVPGAYPCHSIWQEVVHVTFWREATLRLMAGEDAPTGEEIVAQEFAPPPAVTQEAWEAAVAALKKTQDDLARKIEETLSAPDSSGLERICHHLIHDPYHLGRITLLRGMQGTAPKF